MQFGARAALYAAAYGFSVSGDVGFDVLIKLAPLHFIADFHASVQLKHGSQQPVQGVGRGRARRAAAAARERQGVVRDLLVRLLGALRQDADRRRARRRRRRRSMCSPSSSRALSTAQSWSTQAPPNAAHGVALRKLAPGTALVLDPLGRLAVKQQVVPLNTARDIDIFGGAPVAGARRFALAAALERRSPAPR